MPQKLSSQAWGSLIVIFVLWFSSYAVWGAPKSLDPPPVTIPVVQRSQEPGFSQWIQHISQANVIYLGETHDRLADHQAQAEIIQALFKQNPNIALGLEMFQRPFQGVLNRYIAGELTEVGLQTESEYGQRWGFPWSFYGPVLRFAKEHQLPVLALNTPSEITRQVARQGLESLSEADFSHIPPLDEIDLSNQAYRQRLGEIFQAHHQGQSHSPNLDNFFQAQVLWDETMAAVIAEYVQKNPQKVLIVLVGQGHLHYGDGIPSRVERRLNQFPNFRQYSILLSPDPDLAQLSPTGQPLADFLWGLP